MSFATDGMVDVERCPLCGAAHRRHLAWSVGRRIQYRCPNTGRYAYADGDDEGSAGAREAAPRRPAPSAAGAAALVPREEPQPVEAVAS